MLKFSKNIFLKAKMFVKESEVIYGIFWNITFKWNIPIYLFIYLFGKHVLKRPRSYWCLGVLTNVVRWVFDFVTNPCFGFIGFSKAKNSWLRFFGKRSDSKNC
jgi:hypothetical protein